ASARAPRDRCGSSTPASPARGTRASKSRARSPAPGSRAKPRRETRRAGHEAPAPSSAARSNAREAQSPPAPAVHCQESWTSAACRPCPTSLAAVIVVVAKTVSKEFGSDLLGVSDATSGVVVFDREGHKLAELDANRPGLVLYEHGQIRAA